MIAEAYAIPSFELRRTGDATTSRVADISTVIHDTDGMSSLADIGDVSALSDADLGTLLAHLEREERAVSSRRTRLHDRISFVQAGGYANADLADEQLVSLRVTECELSERRRILHRGLDEVHAERSRRHMEA